MNKIEKAFSNGKAFIPFITLGDPSLEFTEKLIIEMAKAGADVIELGIPFSDPSAEGPVIQAANIRGLSVGTNTDKIFDMIERVRKVSNVPLVFLTYVNIVFSYGTERFMKKCKEVGVDGIIVPDIPYEERNEIKPYCDTYGISYIAMVSLTSGDRIERLVEDAKGYVYCVSSLGVTGARDTLALDSSEVIKRIKAVKNVPCAIGFGISTPEQAKAMSEISDGIIVGSAIVKIIEQYGEQSIEPVIEYVKEMIDAIR